jgi:hypothetical protein
MTELSMKFLSVASFYFINGMILLLTKAIGTKKSGKYMYLGLIMLVMVTYPAIYAYIVYNNGYNFAFGLFPDTVDKLGPQVYALITPLTVFGTNTSEPAALYPTFVNIGCTFIGMCSLFLMRKMKINW